LSSHDPRRDAALWLSLYRELGVEQAGGPPRPAAAPAAPPAPAARVRRAPAALLPELAPGEAWPLIRAALAAGDPAAQLEKLRDEVVGDCRRCRLHEGRTKLVFGVGDPGARLMFVGEGPGADEDRQGEPFVGRAGQLLDRIIVAMGLARADVYIANVVKCRPPENRAPLPDEAATCKPFLEAQIAAIQPEVIVTLGKVALEELVGSRIGSITSVRGHWFDYRGLPVKATFHPAYLLRNPAAKRPVWDDMQDVMDRLGIAKRR